MFEIVTWLLDTSMGPPGPHGHWPAWLSVCFHAANLLTSIHLFVVPVIVATLWQYRRDGVASGRYWRIMSMFPFLAMARLVRFAEIMGPPYHLTTLIDVAAAVSTAYSVTALPRLVRHVLMLPSRAEIHELNNRLNAANLVVLAERADLRERNERLTARLTDLEQILATEGWGYEKSVALSEMRALLASSGEVGL